MFRFQISPKTKLSGLNTCPKGPDLTESIVPGSRSTSTARGTYFPPAETQVLSNKSKKKKKKKKNILQTNTKLWWLFFQCEKQRGMTRKSSTKEANLQHFWHLLHMTIIITAGWHVSTTIWLQLTVTAKRQKRQQTTCTQKWFKTCSPCDPRTEINSFQSTTTTNMFRCFFYYYLN